MCELSLDFRSNCGAVDVAPALGRLVLFDARRVWHEVRPARKKTSMTSASAAVRIAFRTYEGQGRVEVGH